MEELGTAAVSTYIGHGPAVFWRKKCHAYRFHPHAEDLIWRCHFRWAPCDKWADNYRAWRRARPAIMLPYTLVSSIRCRTLRMPTPIAT
eukprot:7947420-Pyramimonas_sp.AAC.1